MIIGVHHISVIVRNVEAALSFYKKAFQLPEKDRLSAEASKNRGAWLQLGELELHLQERKEPKPKTEQHFALLTDNLEEIQQKVRELGGRVEEARLIEGVKKRCFVYDLDDNRIELLQK